MLDGGAVLGVDGGHVDMGGEGGGPEVLAVERGEEVVLIEAEEAAAGGLDIVEVPHFRLACLKTLHPVRAGGFELVTELVEALDERGGLLAAGLRLEPEDQGVGLGEEQRWRRGLDDQVFGFGEAVVGVAADAGCVHGLETEPKDDEHADDGDAGEQ